MCTNLVGETEPKNANRFLFYFFPHVKFSRIHSLFLGIYLAVI